MGDIKKGTCKNYLSPVDWEKPVNIGVISGEAQIPSPYKIQHIKY